MSTRSKTLAEAFPEEQERVRNLVAAYDSLGPAGAFGAMMLRRVLKAAEEAAAAHDTVAMLRAYEALQDCK